MATRLLSGFFCFWQPAERALAVNVGRAGFRLPASLVNTAPYVNTAPCVNIAPYVNIAGSSPCGVLNVRY
ncbi:hypothetical protein, partial [Raoultella terrigena]|uniref:hypothetical protein n=1 Tax=Raoultella terrigena TaxID=577 RepID=UPI0038913BC6